MHNNNPRQTVQRAPQKNSSNINYQQMLPPTYSYDILPYGQQYSQQPINQSSNMNNQYAAQYCHQPYPTYYGPAIGDRNRNIQWPNQYPQFNAFNIIDHRSPSRRQDQQQVQRTQEEWSYRRREQDRSRQQNNRDLRRNDNNQRGEYYSPQKSYNHSRSRQMPRNYPRTNEDNSKNHTDRNLYNNTQERQTNIRIQRRGTRQSFREYPSPRDTIKPEHEVNPHESTPKSLQQQQSNFMDNYNNSSSQYSSQCSSQEQLPRRRPMATRKDPVLDNPEQIRKWIEARKRNYPRSQPVQGAAQRRKEKMELSILETKIRKKIMLINSDPRNMLKKLRNIDILRRFIINPRQNYRKMGRKDTIKNRREVDNEMRLSKEEIVDERGTQYNKGQERMPKLEMVIDEPIDMTQQIDPLPPMCTLPATNLQLCKQSSESDVAQQKPIKTTQRAPTAQPTPIIIPYHRIHEETSAEQIIKHLQGKQAEDKVWLENLLDYKSNSANYRYHCQTLETNFVLEEVFKETSYMLQVIRYLTKNQFFMNKQEEHKAQMKDGTIESKINESKAPFN